MFSLSGGLGFGPTSLLNGPNAVTSQQPAAAPQPATRPTYRDELSASDSPRLRGAATLAAASSVAMRLGIEKSREKDKVNAASSRNSQKQQDANPFIVNPFRASVDDAPAGAPPGFCDNGPPEPDGNCDTSDPDPDAPPPTDPANPTDPIDIGNIGTVTPEQLAKAEELNWLGDQGVEIMKTTDFGQEIFRLVETPPVGLEEETFWHTMSTNFLVDPFFRLPLRMNQRRQAESKRKRKEFEGRVEQAQQKAVSDAKARDKEAIQASKSKKKRGR